MIQQYLNLGAIDELEIALAPVLLGSGRRLFENLREPRPRRSIGFSMSVDHSANASIKAPVNRYQSVIDALGRSGHI